MKNILYEADKLTNGDRQKDYGHPADDFSKVAAMTKPIVDSDLHPVLKHALYMAQVKIARLLNTPDHLDSIIDLAGYANTYNMSLEKLQERGEAVKHPKKGDTKHIQVTKT